MRIAVTLFLALCGGCASLSPLASVESIRNGIAGALSDSSLGGYTKNGCLDSLGFWYKEGASAIAHESKPTSGVFFLGDSYLVYDFALLRGTSAQPTLFLQSTESAKALRASTTELTHLSSLIETARHDPLPLQSVQSTHTTCVVFLDSQGNYFVVKPDESKGSHRATDKAIALLSRLSQGAP